MAFDRLSVDQDEKMLEVLNKVFKPGMEVIYSRARKVGYGVQSNSFRGVISRIDGRNAYIAWNHQGASGEECVNIFKLNDLNPEFAMPLLRKKTA